RARHLAAQCVQLVLVEGKKREIRVVFEAWGQDVVRLVRVRIGRVRLGPLRPGAFRTMRLQEVAQLLQCAGCAR
ncbi:rRNA pseudouridine synthase, partial [Treponema pallidum]